MNEAPEKRRIPRSERFHPPGQDRRRKRISILKTILMVIGIATVLYFFVTEVVMRVLALLTPGGV